MLNYDEGMPTLIWDLLISNIYVGKRYANGYEVSSKGDTRFSALRAKLFDGRTVEEVYQLDVKGYRADFNNWRWAKGKPSKIEYTLREQQNLYTTIWWKYMQEQKDATRDLILRMQEQETIVLTDMFANGNISQAYSISEILNSYILLKIGFKSSKLKIPEFNL